MIFYDMKNTSNLPYNLLIKRPQNLLKILKVVKKTRSNDNDYPYRQIDFFGSFFCLRRIKCTFTTHCESLIYGNRHTIHLYTTQFHRVQFHVGFGGFFAGNILGSGLRLRGQVEIMRGTLYHVTSGSLAYLPTYYCPCI